VKLLAIVLFAATAAAQQQPRDAIGSVVIQRGSGPAPFILIAIDAFGEGGRNDGVIDYIYKFYTDAAAPDLHYAFAVAHIDDLDGQILISAPVEQIRLTFANRDQKVAPARNDGSTEFAFTNGIGITRVWGEHVNRGRMSHDGPAPYLFGCGDSVGSACYPDVSGGGGSGSTCSAGGCPATSCSVSNGKLSCSVTCPAGSCACCNYGSMLSDPSCACK